MSEGLLGHSAAVPFVAADHWRLAAYLADLDAPLRGLGEAMQARGRKLEQEAVLLG